MRPGDNAPIDSPGISAPLARRIAAMGGLAAIVLTHRDDVADHVRWADRFGCPRWIHPADADAAPEAEQHIEGDEGHTAGSIVALLGGEILILR